MFLNLGFLNERTLPAKSFQGLPRLCRHSPFYYLPRLDVELQDALTILIDVNVGWIMIRRVPDDNNAEAFPPAHDYLYPKMITLVNDFANGDMCGALPDLFEQPQIAMLGHQFEIFVVRQKL